MGMHSCMSKIKSTCLLHGQTICYINRQLQQSFHQSSLHIYTLEQLQRLYADSQQLLHVACQADDLDCHVGWSRWSASSWLRDRFVPLMGDAHAA